MDELTAEEILGDFKVFRKKLARIEAQPFLFRLNIKNGAYRTGVEVRGYPYITGVCLETISPEHEDIMKILTSLKGAYEIRHHKHKIWLASSTGVRFTPAVGEYFGSGTRLWSIANKPLLEPRPA